MPALTTVVITAIVSRVFNTLSGKVIQGGIDKVISIFKDKRSESEKRLSKIIMDTIIEYEKMNPIDRENDNQMPFYDSEAIVEELLKFRFF